MSKKKIYSFDIFDTLITRQSLNPTGIFSFLQYELMNNPNYANIIHDLDLITNFFSMRIKSEQLARENSNVEEITLDDIYCELQSQFGLSDFEKKHLLDLELSLEMQFLFPIQKNISLLKKIQLNHLVIFCSDMYLPKNYIEKILKKIGLESLKDYIFISSEVGKIKSSGTLFQYLLSVFDQNEYTINHIGDNFHSDCYVPIENNINAFLYNNKTSTLSLIENMLKTETNNDTRAIIEYIFGTSKILLLNNPFSDFKQKEVYNLAVEITAPLFVPFVEWILSEAIRKGISDICFLARDGLLLYQIAIEIVKDLNYDLNLHYIYGSRVAWKLPSLNEINDEYINSILYEPKPKNLENIAQRMGLELKTIKDFFPSRLFNVDLADNDLQEVEKIFRLEDFNSKIMKVASEKRNIIIKYFNNILGKSNKMCLVDLGWSGSSLTMLSKIFELSQYNIHVSGMFFGLFKNPKNSLNEPAEAFSFFFSPENADAVSDLIPGLQEVFECLIPANHGLTIGYKYQNNEVLPILKTYNNKGISEFDYTTYKKGILDYSKLYRLNRINPYDHNWLTIIPYLSVLFKDFKINPKKEYALIFSKISHSVDMAEYSFLPMAAKLNWYNKIKLQRMYDNNRYLWYKIKISHWPEATFKM
ncbi:hypothetical protein KHC33_01325 [Methanospirillum sp. J.3.6.1-F.2.7.3]|uniref:HAD family hydrolase n=1 Tax=Methanospirillum purgamenti TaxID=2834276 RepID=A0A8E7EK73_9EURY|nr:MULTISPECIES: hypothetical protein [Methanospirillum]MDX8549512.1 hypothetical protein [Methanospirillum hungatei]QVV89205.1 hypothetical protein KHC33_01325 [Methanospirillum sp. J.3.6.1-F.2.7.3]